MIQGLPVAHKTYLVKELDSETIVRNPKRRRSFRLQVEFKKSTGHKTISANNPTWCAVLPKSLPKPDTLNP